MADRNVAGKTNSGTQCHAADDGGDALNIARNEEGQTTVITVLCMAVLLGFVALAVDVGMLFRAKRNMQTVADAAATAGALDYYRNGMSTSAAGYAVTAAENAVTKNGLSSVTFSTTCPVTPGSTTKACVQIPPSSGVHTGTGFVEVQVAQPNRTFFMSYFGKGLVNVKTRAVAGIVTGQQCVWVDKTLTVQGNAGLCGVDPSNMAAWTTNKNCGSGTTCPVSGLKASCGVYVGGNIVGSGGGGGSNCIASSIVATAGTASVPLNPAPAVQNSGQQTPPDWMTQAPKAPSSCASWNSGLTGVTYTAAKNKNSPNIYAATLTGTPAAGCYGIDGTLPSGWTTSNTVMNLTLSSATLANGTYLFDLGTFTGGGTLTIGSNVCNYCGAAPTLSNTYAGMTMDLYSGNFSVLSTSSGIKLYAPNDGSNPLNGILLQEPKSNTGTIDIQWGSATSAFYGYVIAPGATLTMQDQGGSALVSGIYVGNMSLNSDLGIVSYDSAVAGSPGHNIALVE
jgi:Flp pilus assembly protein TadG